MNISFKKTILAISIASSLTACGGGSGSSESSGNGQVGQDQTVSLKDVVLRQTNLTAIAQCGNQGGVKLEFGIDVNANGVLDDNEKDPNRTQYVCHGQQGENGINALILSEKLNVGDANCSNGGVKIEVGLDQNLNGLLDLSERIENQTQFICNGTDAVVENFDAKKYLLVTKTVSPGSICANGGYQKQTGYDENGNGVLEANEVISSANICHPNSKPTAELVGDYRLIAGNAFDLSIQGSDSDGNATAVTVTKKPDWVTVEPVEVIRDYKKIQYVRLTGTSPSDEGEYGTIEYQVSDGEDVVTRSVTLQTVRGVYLEVVSPTIESEGSAGEKVYSYTVQLSEALPDQLSVNFDLNGQNMIPQEDWGEENTSYNLVFPAGVTEQQVSFKIYGDTEYEVGEKVALTLKSLSYHGNKLVVWPKTAQTVEVPNDDGNQLSFQTEVANHQVIALLSSSSSQEPEVLLSDAPLWMKTTVKKVSKNGFSGYEVALEGEPPAKEKGSNTPFSVHIQADEQSYDLSLVSNVLESDLDGDGVVNSKDAFPLNPLGATDSDQDGIGDEWELANLGDLTIATATSDYDGLYPSDKEAFEQGKKVNEGVINFESGNISSLLSFTPNWKLVSNDTLDQGRLVMSSPNTFDDGEKSEFYLSGNFDNGQLQLDYLFKTERVYYADDDRLSFYIDGSSQPVKELYSSTGSGWQNATIEVGKGYHQVKVVYKVSKRREDRASKDSIILDNIAGIRGFLPVDSDKDGISDEWEQVFFGNLTTADATTDFDSDSLSDAKEFLANSNPTKIDTDGDGVADNLDVIPVNAFYKSDSDKDGLPDNWELAYFGGLNISGQESDSDGDGILDITEFKNNTYPAIDTDGDGVSDYVDPFPDNAEYLSDTDQDGLPDEWEFQYVDYLSYLYHNHDKDGDGYLDEEEFKIGTNPIEVSLKSNPDTYTVQQGHSITFNPVENDTTAQGKVIVVKGFVTPEVGSLAKNEDGSLTYTAPQRSGGWQRVRYTATDGEESRASELRIYISAKDNDIKQIEAGNSSSPGAFVIDSNDQLWGWGSNIGEHLGFSGADKYLSPQKIDVTPTSMQIATGYSYSYDDYRVVLSTDGVPYELKTNPSSFSISDVKSVAKGYKFTLFLKKDGTVWAQGVGNVGQLGSGSNSNSNSPVQVVDENGNAITDVVAISAGQYFGLALKADGTLLSWGVNNYGQLGDSTTTNRNYAASVQKLTDVIQIDAAAGSAFAVKRDGTVWAWGSDKGRLGISSTDNILKPAQVPNIENVIKVSSGGEAYNTLALTSDGEVYEWGYKGPIIKTDIKNVVDISAGYNFKLAITPFGLLSKGYNDEGQLGDDSMIDQVSWKPVIGMNLLSGVTGLGTESFEWGFLAPMSWHPDAQWQVVKEDKLGGYALKASDVEASKTARVFLGVQTAQGNIHFDVKTSTEVDADKLVFKIDGVEQSRYSGIVDWKTSQDFAITAGRHILSWEYQKDGSTDEGEDAVWIDNLNVPIDSDLDGAEDSVDAAPYDQTAQ